jgi:hypothetical protein
MERNELSPIWEPGTCHCHLQHDSELARGISITHSMTNAKCCLCDRKVEISADFAHRWVSPLFVDVAQSTKGPSFQIHLYDSVKDIAKRLRFFCRAIFMRQMSLWKLNEHRCFHRSQGRTLSEMKHGQRLAAVQIWINVPALLSFQDSRPRKEAWARLPIAVFPCSFRTRCAECGIRRMLGTAYSDPSGAFDQRTTHSSGVVGLVIWIFKLYDLRAPKSLENYLGILLLVILLGCSSSIS